jgi:polysaccharide biosynthesis transport protein
MTTQTTQGQRAPLTELKATDGSLFTFELPEVLHALRRRWWVPALAVTVVGATFCVGAMRQPKVYSATAALVIDPVLPKVLGSNFDVDDSVARSSAEQVFYNTQYNIMHGRSVIREAIARLHLTEDNAFLASYAILAPPGEARIKAVEGALSRNYEVAPEHQSRIAKIVVEDFDPDRAARTANMLGQVYIDLSLESRLSTNRSASKWLDEHVDEFSKQLTEAERALNDFRSTNMLVSVSLEDRKNMVASDLTALNEKIVENRTKMIGLEAEQKILRDAIEGKTEMFAIPRITKNESIQKLKTALSDLTRKRVELASRYGDKHPNITAVNDEIEEVQKLLRHELDLIVATLQNEIDEAKEAESRFRVEMKAATERAMELNKLGVEYNRLDREAENTKKTYESLLKRQTEAGLSGQLESNFVHWQETAEPSKKPVRPSVPLAASLGALLGLVLGLGIVIGGVALDNTIHSQIDVEDRLHLTFLGLLPSISDHSVKAPRREKANEQGGLETPPGRDLFIVDNPTSSVAECARSLRTNLLFLGTDRPLKRLLLTSAGPAEGKSTTVIALGTTMANAGNRVLLIDTDLRRPRLHKTFGVSSEHGLTNVLLETADASAAIKSTGLPGLDVLPCGPLPPNPSELLHTERFHKLLAMLSERYDRLLFDSPPVNAVTDATILSQVVDGTILVVQASKTSKDAARRAARHLVDVKAKLLGVVLNHVDLRDSSYYYRNYYYHYRHGYAYGAEPKTSAKA